MATLTARRSTAKASAARRSASTRTLPAPTKRRSRKSKTTFAILETTWLQIPNVKTEWYKETIDKLDDLIAAIQPPASPTALPPALDVWVESPELIAMESAECALREAGRRNEEMMATFGPNAPDRHVRNSYMLQPWFIAIAIEEPAGGFDLFLGANCGQLVSPQERQVRALSR